MMRVIGLVALLLGGIGLAGCLAGLIALWLYYPFVLRSSAQVVDAADSGLKLVEEKATRADMVVSSMRGILDPVTGKILKLADKTDRTPEDEKELKQIVEAVAQGLGQVDTIAELGETAIAFLTKTSQLTQSLRLLILQDASDKAPMEDAKDSSDSLS